MDLGHHEVRGFEGQDHAELEAIATRWDSSNSLALPTRAGLDESTPMEVDYIGREKDKIERSEGQSERKGEGKVEDRRKGLMEEFRERQEPLGEGARKERKR